jgi:ketosteroid isomerase-like protein
MPRNQEVDTMAEEKIQSVMRDFVGAMASGDVERALSLCTDEATFVSPMGTFRGKEEMRRLLTWMAQSMQDMTVTESGLGIMAQGDRAFFEHVIGATMQGMRAEVLAFCAYEFSGDKIQTVRSTFDRLSMAQQAARGWFAKWLVGLIVKQAQKGLSP